MTGMTPQQATQPANVQKILEEQAHNYKPQSDDPDDIQVTDKVRVLLSKKRGDKSYTEQFSDAVYTVIARRSHHMGQLTYEYDVSNATHTCQKMARYQLVLVERGDRKKDADGKIPDIKTKPKPSPGVNSNVAIPPDLPQSVSVSANPQRKSASASVSASASANPQQKSAPVNPHPFRSKETVRKGNVQTQELKQLEIEMKGSKPTTDKRLKKTPARFL
jgi:hypothetical protein